MYFKIFFTFTEPGMHKLLEIVIPEIKHEWRTVAHSMDITKGISKQLSCVLPKVA